MVATIRRGMSIVCLALFSFATMLPLIVQPVVRKMDTAMLRTIVIAAIILNVGCGQDPENNDSTTCHIDFDKVGQKTECSDAGVK
jgi:hypothetical protein